MSMSVLAHQPEALAAFTQLYGTLWSRGELDHPTKELARLRNARVTDCGDRRNVRFAVARQEGLTEDAVEQIEDDYEQSALSARQKLVLRYTDVFLAGEGPPEAELEQAMQREFSAPEIVELTAGIALFMGFSKIAIACGAAPEAMPTTVVATPGAMTPAATNPA